MLSMQVNEITEKYNDTAEMCTDLHEYKTFMRYLISIVIFGHFQPSVHHSQHDKFIQAKMTSDGRVITTHIRTQNSSAAASFCVTTYNHSATSVKV